MKTYKIHYLNEITDIDIDLQMKAFALMELGLESGVCLARAVYRNRPGWG